MVDGIKLRLGRRDMNVFRTVETDVQVTVHVAGRHAVALCPACQTPSLARILEQRIDPYLPHGGDRRADVFGEFVDGWVAPG
jgi:hypothetical protein